VIPSKKQATAAHRARTRSEVGDMNQCSHAVQSDTIGLHHRVFGGCGMASWRTCLSVCVAVIAALQGCARRPENTPGMRVDIEWTNSDSLAPQCRVHFPRPEEFRHELFFRTFTGVFDGEEYSGSEVYIPADDAGTAERVLFKIAHRGQAGPNRQIRVRIETKLPVAVEVKNLPVGGIVKDVDRGTQLGTLFTLEPGQYHLLVRETPDSPGS